MSDKSGMNAVRFPSKPAKLHRFRLPALSSTLDQLADAPAFDGLVTGFDRQCDFGHDSHDYPSPGCGCAGSPLPPTPGSVERPLVGHRPLIGHLMSPCPAAHTWVALYARLHNLDRAAAAEVRRAPLRAWPLAWPAVRPAGLAEVSSAQGWIPEIVSAKRLETIFGCP